MGLSYGQVTYANTINEIVQSHQGLYERYRTARKSGRAAWNDKAPTKTEKTTHNARLTQPQPDLTKYNTEKSQAAQQRKLTVL